MNPEIWFQEMARPAIRALKPYSSARSLTGSQIPNCIYLDANELPDSEVKWNRYPEPQPKKLMSLLSGMWGTKENEMLITRGSDESIDCLSRTLLREERDAVLITPPTYGMYEVATRLQGCDVLKVPLLKEREFELDVAGILKKVQDSSKPVKMIYLCSPNNPTGSAVPSEKIFELAKLMERKSFVVVDEAYADFSAEGSILSKLAPKGFNEFPSLIVLRTLSKSWGLAGIRIGAMIAHPDLIPLVRKTLAPYPLSGPSVEVALTELSTKAEGAFQKRIQGIIAERERVSEALKGLETVAEVLPSSTNFLLFRSSSSAKIMILAKENGIILRDRGMEEGLEGCIRMTIGNPPENDRVLALLQGISNA